MQDAGEKSNSHAIYYLGTVYTSRMVWAPYTTGCAGLWTEWSLQCQPRGNGARLPVQI